MATKLSEELKEECIRLRVEERLSLSEIQKVASVSQGTLSVWLRPYPLTELELSERAKQTGKTTVPWNKKERGTESWISRAMDRSALSSRAIGSLAECAVMTRALAHGIEVYKSVFDCAMVDVVFHTPSNKLWKIQVKTARLKNTSSQPIVGVTHAARVQGGTGKVQPRKRYEAHEFDFIVGYDLYTDICYVWSFEETKHHKFAITISSDAAERWDKILQA